MLQELPSRDAPAVVLLTASEDEEHPLEAVRLGERGIVLKVMAPRTLERCIRAVYEGREWLTVEGQDLAARLAQRRSIEAGLAQRLTPPKLEVVRHLAKQRDSAEIARYLASASARSRSISITPTPSSEWASVGHFLSC